MRRHLRVGLLAIAAAAMGLAISVYVRTDNQARDAAMSALTRAELKDLRGDIATLARWRGSVLVVNFWASWCAPCREEIPGLMAIQQQYAANGLQVVGIAVDTADKARQAADAMRISYPVLVGGVESVDLTRQLGNKVGGLPYTVVLDREGSFVADHLGILRPPQLDKIVRPLLGRSG
jgi:thiol-disulfide isomerase/thioredoxin